MTLALAATLLGMFLGMAIAALRAGKHVLVEKPAFPTLADYETVRAARDAARRVVVVGENDHPFIGQSAALTAAVPDGQLHVIAGAYHSPQLTHRAEWAAAIAFMVKRLKEGGQSSRT